MRSLAKTSSGVSQENEPAWFCHRVLVVLSRSLRSSTRHSAFGRGALRGPYVFRTSVERRVKGPIVRRTFVGAISKEHGISARVGVWFWFQGGSDLVTVLIATCPSSALLGKARRERTGRDGSRSRRGSFPRTWNRS